MTDGGTTAGAPSPVFVLTSARSCSTITLALLSGHPSACGVLEPTLFPDAPLGDLLSTRFSLCTADGRWHRQALLRAVAWTIHGSLDAAALVEAQRTVLGWAARSSAELLQAMAQAVAPRVLVEKSPRTAAGEAGLRDCLTAFPRARYLHLVRHPIESAHSQMRHWRWRGLFAEASEQELFRRALSDWYDIHSRIRAALNRLPRHQWRRVHAEDVVGRTEPFLDSTLGWLGLARTARIIARMSHPERWVFAGGTNNAYGGDIGFFSDPQLRRIPADLGKARLRAAWGEALVPDTIRPELAALAGRLGYSADRLGAITTAGAR